MNQTAAQVTFQSTLPRRERREWEQNTPLEVSISIHAPAKGATLIFILCKTEQSNFNPRSREGSDSFLLIPHKFHLQFQSTLPRRERRRTGRSETWYKCDFNPRSREGSDWTIASWSRKKKYFNPRSREGSDPTLYPGAGHFLLFQSTLPRRERHA